MFETIEMIRNQVHTSLSVANQILELAQKNGSSVTPMQLLKLVYLSHGWMLGLKGDQLVKENIEAWKYGPVIRPLYNAVRDYKSSAIIALIKDANSEEYSEYEVALIKEVYEKYGKFSGVQLSTLTHSEGSPWHITWNKLGENSIISNDLIENYYNNLSKSSS